jgi:hypothetical protein
MRIRGPSKPQQPPNPEKRPRIDTSQRWRPFYASAKAFSHDQDGGVQNPSYIPDHSKPEAFLVDGLAL